MSKVVSPPRDKWKALSSLLEEEYVLVHVDTKGEGVIVPQHLREGATVTLKLSRLFRGSLELTAERVTAELLFNGTYFTCIVPLASVWGVTSAKGSNLVWPESAPEEVLDMLVRASSSPTTPPGLPTTSRKPEAIKGGKPEKGGHLKRVK